MPSDTVSGKSDIENVDWRSTTATGHHLPTVRFGSSSSQTSQTSGDICRICHCESDPQNPLLTPCYCSGSLKYVHQTCLQQWLTASETNSCELCKFPFIMHTKIKPFNEWRSLDMSGVERRRLFCAVLFHCAAALCVIWSLCVLIERAAEEVKRGQIGWPFWTKLVVVTVGLTGGVVFMYIQCRQYLHLCNRWRARNRILLIQNAPEKFHPPQSPILPPRHIPRNSSSLTTGLPNQNSANPVRPHLHGQIIANIENNPMHYERDWTLDDVSQVSFKPCPQGSGSLTPFHDSVHNMYENPVRLNSSDNSSHDSANEQNFNELPSSGETQKRTNELNLFKLGTEQLKYPTSAVFLENCDILNDATYPKLYHRHSAVIISPVVSDNLDKLLGKDTRRYSDTKLLQHHNKSVSHSSNQIFNVTNILGPTILPAPSAANTQNNQPQITDIIFERNGSGNFDPLELNIQEMLELDIKTQQSEKKSQLSLNNQPQQNTNLVCIEESNYAAVTSPSGGRHKNLFKSLPNLNASSENLLQ